MRIAHISDIHADISSAFQNRFHALLHSIRNQRIDHLMITGDLTDKATGEEYEVVIRILNEYGFSSGENITVIPGNHDLYPSVYQSFTFRLSTLRQEFREDPVRVTKELYRVLRAYRKFTPEIYRKALHEFVSRFQWTFDNAISLGPEATGGFPYLKHLNDEYAAVCLESNYVSPHIKSILPYALIKYAIKKDMFAATDSPICSNGWIDIELLNRALFHPEVKHKKLIILLHHYLYPQDQVLKYMSKDFERTMTLVNKNHFLDVVRESNPELILHGHWHVTEEYSLCNGRIRALNGGGLFQQNRATWNLITLTGDGLTRSEINFIAS